MNIKNVMHQNLGSNISVSHQPMITDRSIFSRADSKILTISNKIQPQRKQMRNKRKLLILFLLFLCTILTCSGVATGLLIGYYGISVKNNTETITGKIFTT
jgi:hypothetical protein